MLRVWVPVKLCNTRKLESSFSLRTWSRNYVYDISWAVWQQRKTQANGKSWMYYFVSVSLLFFFSPHFWLYKTRMLPHGNNEGATTGATAAAAATFCIEKLFCSKYLPSIFIRLPPATFDKLWLCYFCCHSPSSLLPPALCGLYVCVCVCFFSQTMAVSCHDSAATLYNKCSK